MLERMLPKGLKVGATWKHLESSGIRDSGGHARRKERGHSTSKRRTLNSPLACVLDED
jgi:hypothetical protein